MSETMIDKAEHNLTIAEILYNTMMDDAYLNYIGYHIQQATELILKQK